MKGMFQWVVLALVITSISVYAQLYSTQQGGPWSSPSTWEGGTVPTSNDDVVIVGPVTLDKVQDYSVHSLTIRENGSLKQVAYSNWKVIKFFVTTDIWNKGHIEGYAYSEPVFYVGRDVFNEGTWIYSTIKFTDTTRHILRSLPGSVFAPKEIRADSATVVSDRDFEMEVQGFSSIVWVKKLELLPDFSGQQTTFWFKGNVGLYIGTIVGNGNSIAGDSASFVARGRFDGKSTDPVWENLRIKGIVNLDVDVVARDTLVIEDTLKIRDEKKYWEITLDVQGDIINQGAILPSNLNDYLEIDVSGTVINRGTWYASQLMFTADSIQYLESDTTRVFYNFYVQGSEDTIISKGNIRFDDGTIRIQKLVLQQGHHLVLNNQADFSVRTLVGNGNTIYFKQGGYLNNNLGSPTFHDVALMGDIRFDPGARYYFDGNVINMGIMRPRENANWDIKITVMGDFENQGAIAFNSNNVGFLFNLKGNLESWGPWDSPEVTIDGNRAQRIVVRDTARFSPSLHIYSDRQGNTYQWLKDGVPLANSSHFTNVNRVNLIIQNVTLATFGVYQCRVDSSGDTLYSREVQIWDGVTAIEEEREALQIRSFKLLGNFPNPFNATTEIVYQLPRPYPVILRVYDVQGQQVKEMVFEVQPHGTHRIRFQAEGLASGVYLYEILAGPFRDVGKMVLVK